MCCVCVVRPPQRMECVADNAHRNIEMYMAFRYVYTIYGISMYTLLVHNMHSRNSVNCISFACGTIFAFLMVFPGARPERERARGGDDD